MGPDQIHVATEQYRLRNKAGTVDIPIAEFDSSGRLVLGSSAVTVVLASNPILANGTYFEGLNVAGAVKRLIGVTTGDVVSIDADAVGVLFGGVVSGPSDVLSIQRGTNGQEVRIFGTTTASKFLGFSHTGTNAFVTLQSGSNLFLSGADSFSASTDNGPTLGASANRWSNVLTALVTIGVATNRQGYGFIGADDAASLLLETDVTSTVGSNISFIKGRGTNASRTVVASGDSLGLIVAYGYDGAALRSAAQINFAVDATPGSSDMPGRIEFYVTPDGSASVALALTISNTKRATFAERIVCVADVTTAVAVASLPTSPAEGTRCAVTDSNAVSFTAGIGAVVAAGGTTHVPVYYDGTNWRIG